MEKENNTTSTKEENKVKQKSKNKNTENSKETNSENNNKITEDIGDTIKNSVDINIPINRQTIGYVASVFSIIFAFLTKLCVSFGVNSNLVYTVLFISGFILSAYGVLCAFNKNKNVSALNSEMIIALFALLINFIA